MVSLLHRATINNNTCAKVYGVFIMTTARARVHPVQLLKQTERRVATDL